MLIEKISTPPELDNPATGEYEFSYDTAGRLIAPDGKDVTFCYYIAGMATQAIEKVYSFATRT